MKEAKMKLVSFGEGDIIATSDSGILAGIQDGEANNATFKGQALSDFGTTTFVWQQDNLTSFWVTTGAELVADEEKTASTVFNGEFVYVSNSQIAPGTESTFAALDGSLPSNFYFRKNTQ